ncbi:myosin-8-like [Maniola hyperantus]|uniref:myosin-8-like n=1 Tax=Aphantopus hyperantus TaxID=2795564 RepID=UPI003749BA75
MADLKRQNKLPQEGTDCSAEGKSLTDVSSVCPTYSGGGKIRSPKSSGEEEEERRTEKLVLEGGENLEEEKRREKLEELIDPFTRRESLRRTPPGQSKILENKNTESDVSAEAMDADILCDEDSTPNKELRTEEDRRPKKRKKVSSPTIIQPSEIEPSEELKKIKAKVEELAKFTRENKKVHSEVKKFASDLTSLVRQTVTKYKYDMAKFYELQQEFNTYRKSQEHKVSELAEQIEKVKQDYEKRFDELRQERNTMHKKSDTFDKKFDLNQQEIKEYDQLMTKLHVEWTPDSFRNVKVDHGDIFKDIRNNAVYFCEEQTKLQSRTGKRVLNRYPEILDGDTIICEGGSYNILERSVTLLANEGSKTKTNKVIVVFYDPSKQDGRSQHDVYLLCQEIKKIAVKYSMSEISFITPQGIATDVMKKILEVIFHNSEIFIFLRAKKKITPQKGSKHLDRNEEVIIIEGDSDSYAQVLRKLKNGLKGSNALDQIKGVRKSNKGDVLVQVRENALEVSKTIKDIVENKKVKTLTKKTKTTVHIKNIDSVADMEEVRTAILDTKIVQSPEQLEVRSLRPMQNGNQIATVVLESNDADELLEMNKIRIGLCICQAQQRIDVLKCYRCWAHDHIAAKCTGVDRSQKCHICAQDGHKAKNCTNKAFCPLCNIEGHSSGSGSCKRFQQALAKARQNKRRKDSVINR